MQGPSPAARPPGDGGSRADRGRRAEDLAVRAVERLGWRILARNLRAARGELDVCASHRGVLHVVEVRSRTGRRRGTPLETVGAAKRRTLARTLAAALAAGLLPRHREVRFDVASVVWLGADRDPEVTIHPDAFDAVDLL